MKKFAQKVEALKRKVRSGSWCPCGRGLLRAHPAHTGAGKSGACARQVKYPDGEVLAQATLKWKARCARGDPRRFLASAVEGMEFSKQGQEVIDRLNLAMDEVEKEAGPPTAANKKAAEMLKKKLKVRCNVRTCCWQGCRMQHSALLISAQPCAAGQNA